MPPRANSRGPLPAAGNRSSTTSVPAALAGVLTWHAVEAGLGDNPLASRASFRKPAGPNALAKAWRSKIQVSCPHCRDIHKYTVCEAFVETAISLHDLDGIFTPR